MKHFRNKFRLPAKSLIYFFIFSFSLPALGFTPKTIFAMESVVVKSVQLANTDKELNLWAASDTVTRSEENQNGFNLSLKERDETLYTDKKNYWKKAVGISLLFVLAAALLPRDMTMRGGEDSSSMWNPGLRW